jgi:hypothetical protein
VLPWRIRPDRPAAVFAAPLAVALAAVPLAAPARQPAPDERQALTRAADSFTGTKSGWQETGFLPNTFFPSLQASLSSAVPTREGWDFLAFILKMKRLHHFAPGSHFAGTH